MFQTSKFLFSSLSALVSTHRISAPSFVIQRRRLKVGVICGTNRILLPPVVRKLIWPKVSYFSHLKCNHLEWNLSWDWIQPFSLKPWWSCSKPSLPWSHSAWRNPKSFPAELVGILIYFSPNLKPLQFPIFSSQRSWSCQFVKSCQ